MNYYELKDPEVKRRAKEAWLNETEIVRDNLEGVAESTAEELQALSRAEERLRHQELQDARDWKIMSRDKWIAANAAPARYFFTKLRAKWARESIELLETEDGVILTEEEIFSEIHDFYQTLYTAEEETETRWRCGMK
ncbi:hypothetical protein R1sor_002378 [Riccia sorocarpa]|uniref:Uncharacterized protein n=1 Tax=Riccia sorocarpa TaxID=122646 RepID=A0ABD3H2T6_9MARC